MNRIDKIILVLILLALAMAIAPHAKAEEGEPFRVTPSHQDVDVFLIGVGFQ